MNQAKKNNYHNCRPTLQHSWTDSQAYIICCIWMHMAYGVLWMHRAIRRNTWIPGKGNEKLLFHGLNFNITLGLWCESFPHLLKILVTTTVTTTTTTTTKKKKKNHHHHHNNSNNHYNNNNNNIASKHLGEFQQISHYAYVITNSKNLSRNAAGLPRLDFQVGKSMGNGSSTIVYWVHNLGTNTLLPW